MSILHVSARALYAGAVPRPRKLHLDDVAALTGLGVSTLRGYRARAAKQNAEQAAGRSTTRPWTMPEPDGTDVEAGHARPWWWESTVKAWMAQRPGKGWRKGQTSV